MGEGCAVNGMKMVQEFKRAVRESRLPAEKPSTCGRGVYNCVRGQASVEFIVTLAVLLIILIAAFSIYISISDATLDRIRYLKAKNAADTLAAGINGLAMQGGVNATTYAQLERPSLNYSIEGGSLRASMDGIVAYSRLLTGNVSLNFSGTALKLRSQNGVVYVEDAE
ncbi:MAG: hypothetical protein N3H30_02715 [Candidatus Micrarchaeota archaeon]|nr:hypothetical protein [Candidatus Micrarchaeota archaeon]